MATAFVRPKFEYMLHLGEMKLDEYEKSEKVFNAWAIWTADVTTPKLIKRAWAALRIDNSKARRWGMAKRLKKRVGHYFEGAKTMDEYAQTM